jgi:hypothetical protein
MKDTTNSRASPCSSSVLRVRWAPHFSLFFLFLEDGSYIAELFEVTEYLNAIDSNTLLPKSCFLVYKYICVRVLFFSFFQRKSIATQKSLPLLFLGEWVIRNLFNSELFSVSSMINLFFIYFFNSFTLFFIIIGPFFFVKEKRSDVSSGGIKRSETELFGFYFRGNNKIGGTHTQTHNRRHLLT